MWPRLRLVGRGRRCRGGRRPDDLFGGVADHELIGLVCAWDLVEAHAAARKLIAIAEVFRRNPAEDGFEPEPGQMPQVVHEFTRDQLAPRWANPAPASRRC